MATVTSVVAFVAPSVVAPLKAKAGVTKPVSGASPSATPVKEKSARTKTVSAASQFSPPSDRPLKTYEVRINTQLEWLVLEQLKLGIAPTHFLKLRRGNRTVSMSVVPKAEFDRWSRDLMAVKTARQPSCAHPFEVRANVDGVRYSNRFCPGTGGDPALRNLSKSTDEMLGYLRRHDALKLRRK